MLVHFIRVQAIIEIIPPFKFYDSIFKSAFTNQKSIGQIVLALALTWA